MIRVVAGVHRWVGAPSLARLHEGFPPRGPQDRVSCATANALVGNTLHAGAMEFTLQPAALEVERDCHLVVGGPPCDVRLGGVAGACWQVFRVAAGTPVVIRMGSLGCRFYVAVAGGLDATSDGGTSYRFAGRPLGGRAGRVRPPAWAAQPWAPRLGRLRVTRGPEWIDDCLSVAAGPWRVDPRSGGMGVRLAGPALPLPTFDIVSAPVQDGTLQATSSGLVVLLRGRGTLGGYPRVGNLLASDVDRAAQLRPGDVVRLDWVDRAAARRHCRQYESHWKALESALGGEA